MITRMVLQTSLMFVAVAAILFLAGGEWRWPQAWVFLGESGFASFAVGFWLLRHDPALLESRLSGPVRRDQMPWDRIFMVAVGFVFIGWMVLIALDARRFGWSFVPIWLETLGFVLIALGMVVVQQTFRFNSFAAPQVRLQTAQLVATEGPYRIVRHPMYAGSMLYLLGMALLLGSWWGAAAVPLMSAGIAARAVGEERMLRRELAGYDEYASRVRFRLIPGLW
jgi:protein-S-isoprenylcysteine O-methyltransferase Ste14